MTMQAAAHVRLGSPDAVRARNVEAVRTFLRLLEQGDVETWGQLWAEGGRQDMPYAPPGFPESFVGRARLIEHFSGLPHTFDHMRFPDLAVHATTNPDAVVAEFRGDIRVKDGGRKYDNRYVNIFRFDAAGLITQVVEYFNPLVLTQADAFGKGGVPRGAAQASTAASGDVTDLSAWARSFFETVDARDPDRIAAFFTDDVRLVFGNRPVIEGREAARQAFAATAGALKAVRHDVTGIWHGQERDAQVASVEAHVTYSLPDDRQVTVPCTSTLRIRNGRIADYRIFIDTTPVFGPQ